MFSSKPPIFTYNLDKRLDFFIPLDKKPILSQSNHSESGTTMWRNIAKQAVSKSNGLRFDLRLLLNAYSSFGHSQGSILPGRFKVRSFEAISSLKCGFLGMSNNTRNNGIWSQGEDSLGSHSNSGCLRNQIGFGDFFPKGVASVAEAVTSTDVEEDSHDEVEDSMKEMRKEERMQSRTRWRNIRNMSRGMTQSKYQLLRRRQVKIEAEAREEAAKEYRELLMDVCEQKLAPNLPYVKTLFLGWFEPFRDAIAKEQELCQAGKIKTSVTSIHDG